MKTVKRTNRDTIEFWSLLLLNIVLVIVARFKVKYLFQLVNDAEEVISSFGMYVLTAIFVLGVTMFEFAVMYAIRCKLTNWRFK